MANAKEMSTALVDEARTVVSTVEDELDVIARAADAKWLDDSPTMLGVRLAYVGIKLLGKAVVLLGVIADRLEDQKEIMLGNGKQEITHDEDVKW